MVYNDEQRSYQPHTHTHTHARREGGREAILTRFPSWSNLQVVLVFLQLNSYYLDNYISDSHRELLKIIISLKPIVAK